MARYHVELPDGMRIGATPWSSMTVSPDGSKLVYVGENGRLFLRLRDRLESVELMGTEGAFNPFFSHDGLRVGYMSGTAGSAEIKVVSLAGGPPTTIISKGVGGPGAVSIDRGGPGLNVAATNDIAVLDLATHKHRVLVRGVFARYARSGHILYVTSNGVLMAVPFDQDRMVLTGSPVALLEGVSVLRGGGGGDLTISETGTLWYGSGSTFSQLEVVWATRSGEISEVDPGWVGEFRTLALSPDGVRLAVSIVDATAMGSSTASSWSWRTSSRS